MTRARDIGPAPDTTSPIPGRSQRLVVGPADGFRGLAVIAVVLIHVIYSAGRPMLDDGLIRNVLISGYFGMDLLFVLSGFLLFLPTVTSGGSFGSVRGYLIRRGSRIFPAYYVSLAALLLFLPLMTASSSEALLGTDKGLFNVFLHLTLLQHSVGLLNGLPEGFFVNGAIWTLALDAAFYLLLPLVAAWYYRRPFLGLAIALAASSAWKWFAVHSTLTMPALTVPDPKIAVRMVLVTQFPTYLAHFALGMTAAWLYVKNRNRKSTGRYAAVLAVQVGCIAAIIAGMNAAGMRDMSGKAGLYDHWTATGWFAATFALLLLATSLAPSWAQAPFTNRTLRKLGDMSYGIYLWHLPLVHFALTTLKFPADATPGAFFGLLAFVLPMTLAAAWLSLRFVEQPIRRWAVRRSRKLEIERSSVSPSSLLIQPAPATSP
jgi:peptidoglycan/LPS O-acetylase OafA/YrhL